MSWAKVDKWHDEPNFFTLPVVFNFSWSSCSFWRATKSAACSSSFGSCRSSEWGSYTSHTFRCFCFPYSSFSVATSTSLHGATFLHLGQFHCWSRLVHDSLLYSHRPSCTNSSSVNRSAAMWLQQQPPNQQGKHNMQCAHNHLQSGITWPNMLNTLART